MSVAKQETQDLLDFADAIREMLGLDPLTRKETSRSDAERFYARHELPACGKGRGIAFR